MQIDATNGEVAYPAGAVDRPDHGPQQSQHPWANCMASTGQEADRGHRHQDGQVTPSRVAGVAQALGRSWRARSAASRASAAAGQQVVRS